VLASSVPGITRSRRGSKRGSFEYGKDGAASWVTLIFPHDERINNFHAREQCEPHVIGGGSDNDIQGFYLRNGWEFQFVLHTVAGAIRRNPPGLARRMAHQYAA
jgi:hypothetical protein